MQDDRNQSQQRDQQTGNDQQQNIGNSNPQSGAEWDNYQTRTLSGKPGREGGDDALASRETDEVQSSDE